MVAEAHSDKSLASNQEPRHDWIGKISTCMDKKHIQSFVESMAFVNYSIVGNSQPAPPTPIYGLKKYAPSRPAVLPDENCNDELPGRL